MDNELNNRIDSLIVAHINNLKEHYKVHLSNLSVPTIEIEEGSKFVKLVTNNGSSRSVYAFIAKADGGSKALGNYKRGDILKPASWSQPAKHARGNVFSDDFGISCCGIFGVSYLR